MPQVPYPWVNQINSSHNGSPNRNTEIKEEMDTGKTSRKEERERKLSTKGMTSETKEKA